MRLIVQAVASICGKLDCLVKSTPRALLDILKRIFELLDKLRLGREFVKP